MDIMNEIIQNSNKRIVILVIDEVTILWLDM